MLPRIYAAALAVLCLTATVPAIAGDTAQGRALAERLCSNCHLVGTGQAHANADIPTFREIARKEGQTEAMIMARIMLPKHPMPQIPLSRSELADLAAYIMTLRE